MPNRKVHSKVGGFSGGVFYLIDMYSKDENFHFGHILSVSLGGIIGSALPDKIDTPNNPNHRALAHSIFVNGSISLNIKDFFIWIDNQDIYDWIKWFIKGLIIGYLSHICLDFVTPKGIPLA